MACSREDEEADDEIDKQTVGVGLGPERELRCDVIQLKAQLLKPLPVDWPVCRLRLPKVSQVPRYRSGFVAAALLHRITLLYI